MGRLSTFAKNRILNLRFQKSFRIKQIALTLQQEDNIKVSRKSISTFLKKYIETKSINDKPRSGRNKKLTPEEINLIGEVTRLNRDITAPKIKEYLNLNVSTYTILRASKLFEWNKLNPNSNEAKKAAALERQANGEVKRRRTNNRRRSTKSKANSNDETMNTSSDSGTNEPKLRQQQTNASTTTNPTTTATTSTTITTITGSSVNSTFNQTLNESRSNETIVTLRPTSSLTPQQTSFTLTDPNLNLISEEEILLTKNASSSPMVFATKVLYKIFNLNELLGHNVSGKTFNKFIKNKKALDEKRINYIKWLVENYFDMDNKEELWKACRTAINKSIRNNEIKGQNASINSTIQQSMPSTSTSTSATTTTTTTTTMDLNTSNTNLTIVTLNKNEIIPINSIIDINNEPSSSSSSSSSASSSSSLSTSSTSATATSVGVTKALTLNSSGVANSTATINSNGSTTYLTLQPNMSIFQITNDLPADLVLNKIQTNTNYHQALNSAILKAKSQQQQQASLGQTTSIVTLTDTPHDFDGEQDEQDENKTFHMEINNLNSKQDNKDDDDDDCDDEPTATRTTTTTTALRATSTSTSTSTRTSTLSIEKLNKVKQMNLLNEREIIHLKNSFCSPMIFATKVLIKIFTKNELLGHNISGKTFHKNLKNKKPLDENRISYIKWLVETYFDSINKEAIWKSCRKAINRVIRNFEIKESKLIKSIDGLERGQEFNNQGIAQIVELDNTMIQYKNE